ncbi:hypothetical protein JMUB7529_28170 [Staphylococcus aureus]
MYKVIERFEDAQDNGHEYQVGDTYPRDGLEVSEERFTELSTTCLLYTSPSPRDMRRSRMPSSA